MFEVSVATVFRVVKNEGLNVKFQKGRHPSSIEMGGFQKFLSGENVSQNVESNVQGETVEVNVQEIRQEPVCDMVSETIRNATRLDSFTMNFSGEINIEMIANSLRYIIGSGRKATISISCEIDNA